MTLSSSPSLPPPSRPKAHLWPFVLGGIGLIVVNLAIGLFTATGIDATSGEARAGEVIGLLLFQLTAQAVVIGVVYGIARLVRRRKSPPRLVVVAFYSLGVVALVQGASALGRLAGSGTFTPEERAGLLVTRDSISHELLGFSAPNPGGAYSAAPDLQRRSDSTAAAHPDLAVWALRSAGRGNLIIQAVKFSGMSEIKFRAFASGFRKQMANKADTVFEDTVTWVSSRGEYRFGGRLRINGATLRSRCLSRSQLGSDMIVCLQAAAADTTGLGDVPAGLTLK